jgi:hypothetical protein
MVGAVRRAYNQAVVCKEAKDFDGAFKLYEEALAIRQHVYGTSSQVIGEQLYNMANARVLQGSRAGELLAGYRPPAARVWITLLLFLHRPADALSARALRRSEAIHESRRRLLRSARVRSPSGDSSLLQP